MADDVKCNHDNQVMISDETSYDGRRIRTYECPDCKTFVQFVTDLWGNEL